MKIADNIRPDRQTVMFSATFPRQMEALARKILTKPIEVQVGGRSVVCKDVMQNIVSRTWRMHSHYGSTTCQVPLAKARQDTGVVLICIHPPTDRISVLLFQYCEYIV